MFTLLYTNFDTENTYLRQPSTMSVILYYQCLAKPSDTFSSTMQEGDLLVLKDEQSTKDEIITFSRKTSAEQVSDQFYLKSYCIRNSTSCFQ